MSNVVITAEEYKRLLIAEKVLQALERAGVDNWDGYGFAFEELRKTDPDFKDED